MNDFIQIDSEFKNLIPPLTTDEYKQLEDNLLAEGCRDALIIWNNTIIDGHNRYEICNKYNLAYRIEEKHFENRDEVKEWIIRNQFGRRNLSAFDRSKLALRLEELIKAKAKKNQGTRTDLQQISAESFKPVETREEIAKIAGVSHDTIDKVKVIEKEATPEQKAKLSAGEAKINTVFTDIQHVQAVEKYPALEVVPKMEAIKTAKKLDTLPEATRIEVAKKIVETKKVPDEIKGDISFMLEPGYEPPEERVKRDPVVRLRNVIHEFKILFNSVTKWHGMETAVQDNDYQELVTVLDGLTFMIDTMNQWKAIISSEIKNNNNIRRIK